MRKWLRASALALGLCLAGCGTTVVGHCELPEELAIKSIPLDPVTAGMGLEAQHKQWLKDRAHAAKSDRHADDLIDYVGKNCQ